jgi:hypothetical protein
MITDIKELKRTLTAEEGDILDALIFELTRRRKMNKIRGDRLLQWVNETLEGWDMSARCNGVTLRKIVNVIRSNSLLPVIATSQGYYCSFDEEEVQKQISSLRKRAEAINRAADGLQHFVDSGKTTKTVKQATLFDE